MASDTELLGRGLAIVDGDLVLGPDGLELVEGLPCLHQGLAHRLQTRVGELTWDASAGLPLDRYIEAEVDVLSRRGLGVMVMEQCEADRRVEVGSVHVEVRQVAGDEILVDIEVQPIGQPDVLALVVPLPLGVA